MSQIFLNQIAEDIKNIQEYWQYNDKKLSDFGYAFNYWVLNYLFHMDIEDIEEHITEYNDKGIDCFVHYEDTKELYIIQNSYFSESSPLKRDHVSDFLLAPLSSLINGTYTRSKTLQEIFDKIKNDPDYTIYLKYYTTKSLNSVSKDVINLFETNTFPQYAFRVDTEFIDIDKLYSIYNGDRYEKEKSFEYSWKVVKKELINYLSSQHGNYSGLDAAYIAVDIIEIYNMYMESEHQNYNLFEKNIREYLGLKGKDGKINKSIQDTLKDEVERNRFFFYNNGITIICDDYSIISKHNMSVLSIKNPQIVNGCQTVNTIVNTIASFMAEDKATTKQKFKNCSVLVKFFKINKESVIDKNIYENIVRYTNSQATISLKDFVSKDDYFLRLQQDFLKRGFYLIVKQSDQNKFSNDKDFVKNKNLAIKKCELFDIEINKPKDLFISLEKLLKALMAFYFDGHCAYVQGKCVLKENSTTYYAGFSKKINDFFTVDNMINLYLVYVKAGGIKRGRVDRYPIPYYMMDFLGRYIKGENYNTKYVNEKLKYLFSSKEIFDQIYKNFSEIIEDYSDKYMEKNNVDYSIMIKGRDIDVDLLNEKIKDKKREATRHNDCQYFLKYLDESPL